MKACVLHAIGDLKFEEVPTPMAHKGEVLVKIRASGVCGSDIHRVFSKGTYNFPTILGHEFAGQIVELGESVDKKLIGKKVAIFPMLPCMNCEACQIGEYAQCNDYNYLGSRCDGGFAEYISVPVWNLIIIPDTLSYEEAAMVEPAAVAIHALRRASIQISDNIAIFGAGPIGLMLGQWALAWGADHIMLVDIDEERIAFAKKMGFSYTLNNTNGKAVKWIKEITEGRGADVAVEGAGVSHTFEQCLECTRPFGSVVAMGNPLSEMVLSQKVYWELMRKQLKILGTWNSSFASLPKNDWKLAIRAMEKQKINVKPLITHKCNLDGCREALEMMRDKKMFFNKVMFIID